jgi:hypothetical protein
MDAIHSSVKMLRVFPVFGGFGLSASGLLRVAPNLAAWVLQVVFPHFVVLFVGCCEGGIRHRR